MNLCLQWRCTPRLGADGITRCSNCDRPLKTRTRKQAQADRAAMEALWLQTFGEAFSKTGCSYSASHQAVCACKEYRARWENIG